MSVAPNKALGQHWLHDVDTLRAIVNEANLGPADTVLEIGPGLGTLTDELLQVSKEVIAVEYDHVLAQKLAKKYKNIAKVTIIEHDILTFNLTELPKNYVVVANIPYYLTSKLVRILCESDNLPKRAVLLVQKEVARRIAAKAGDMSILSVSAQVYNNVSLGINVKAELFTPPPKVDSQVVVLERRNQPLVDFNTLPLFFRVVKSGFSERRKKLRSSLSGGLILPKDKVDELLVKSNINPNARAQELSIDDWLNLVKNYKSSFLA